MNYDDMNPKSLLGEFPASGRRHGNSFETPPRDSMGFGGPVGGGGVFHQVSDDSGFSVNKPLLPGQKRWFPFSSQKGVSPDLQDGAGFAKLFVGSVPRTATEEDIRPLFEDHGHVIEVALIKDRRTGHQQGCCFVKYATLEEADRAISGLHNQYMLPGGVAPIQVRYADGERERIGSTEYKLFVGSLHRQASERDVEEIFSPYGDVEDIYIMRDDRKQSRGCGFVKFSRRDMAVAALNALNGIYTMRGCDNPLIVRFADPKRPRAGEPRPSPAPEGPGFGPRSLQPGTGIQRNPVELSSEPKFPCNPKSNSPRNMTGTGASVQGNQIINKPCDLSVKFPSGGGSFGSFSSSVDVSALGVSSTTFSLQQMSPQKKPIQSSQNVVCPLQPQPILHTSSAQPSDAPVWPPRHAPVAQPPELGHQIAAPEPFVQKIQPPVQQIKPHVRQLPPVSVPQQQTRQNAGIPPNVVSAAGGQAHPPPVYTQQQQPEHSLQQPPSQLATLLSKQTQSLQARFQSSQQAFSQLQQQLQLIHPVGHGSFPQQNPHFTKPEHQKWVDSTVPQTVSSTNAITPTAAAATDTLPLTPMHSVPVSTQTAASVNCYWSEHTSPDGYKYYYNSFTGESRWEKPMELTLYQKWIQSAQNEQKPLVQELAAQSEHQTIAAEPLPQPSQLRMQPQLYQQQQQQQQQQPQQQQNPFHSQGNHMAQDWAWRK